MKYLMFVPKGSIFFHGDNINEPQILFTKLEIPEKIVLLDNTGKEYYKYKINEKNFAKF